VNDEVLNWKRMPMLFLDAKFTGNQIIEVAILQYDVANKASFTQSWVVRPAVIDLSDSDTQQALKNNEIDLETFHNAPLLSYLVSTLNRIAFVAAVWCGHGLPRIVEAVRQEARKETPCMPDEYKLLLDTEVIDRGLHPGMEAYDLRSVAGRWQVDCPTRQAAIDDAVLCCQVLKAMMPKLPDDPNEILALYTQWGKR
jgi:DNA polymerase III epsilon subunit-like protein